MAFDDDDDLDQEERWDGNKKALPSDLRRYVNKLERENKTLTEQVATAQKVSRQQTIQTVLAAKGVSPKLAAFIQPDVEASEEAVSKWIEQYADVFNLTAPAQTPAAPEAQVDPRTGQPLGGIPAPHVPQTYTLQDQQAQQAMTAAASGGTPIEVAGDLIAKIAAAQTPDELNALIGVPGGARFGA